MRHLTVVLLLILLSPVILISQEDQWYLDKPIAEISFKGLSSVSKNELLGLVRPYVNQQYSDALSWEIQSKLYALDYFDLIIPEIVPDDLASQSLHLVFQVQEKPLISEILFRGNSKVRRSDLTNAVLVKPGDFLNSGSLNIDEKAVIDLYLEKGFIDAQAKAEYHIDEKTNQAMISFNIVEGNQTKISKIRFVGNDTHVSDRTLLHLMKTKTQSLFSKGLFVETKLQEDLKAIEWYYGDQGFIDVKILDVNKDIVFDQDEHLNKMVITIIIEEGETWTYTGMTFNGNKIYSDEELEALVLQQPGKTFSRTKFQTDYQRVTDQYFENGYIFNTFTYEEERVDRSREVFYVVNITERDRAHIENITIRGNDRTKSYVILRELMLEEGEVFSKAKILAGTRNLYNLQFFDVIDPNPYPGSSDGMMDLLIDVSEGKTTNIGFGLSFSGGPDFPISGQLTWNDKNFLGRGQILGTEINVSPDTQKATLRFTEPRIFGGRWSGNVDLSWNHHIHRRINQDTNGDGFPDGPFETWEEYEKSGRIVPGDYQMEYNSHFISLGINTGYTWVIPLGRLGFSVGLSSAWEYVDYDAAVYRPHSQVLRENLKTWKYDDSFSMRLSWDTRDLQFDPTKGFILSENLIFAGLLPFSRRDYIKSITRFNYNLLMFSIPVNDKGGVFKGILYFNTAFSALINKPWSATTADRQRDGFYIDGMFVGPGWETSSGYRYLWDNSLQIKFPIVPNILAFDIFLDVVGAWVATDGLYQSSNALLKMHINDWRFSLGAGFRFANPQFPIGIYLVKKFRWDHNGHINWNPEPQVAEFKKAGLDILVAFNLSIY